MTGSAAVVASISDGAMRWPQVPLVISPREHRDQASGEQKDQHATRQQPPTTFDGILEGFELPRDKRRQQASGVLKEDFWSGMPTSTLKRKGCGGKSPLGTIVEDEESGHPSGSLQLAEFDVIVTSPGIERPEDAALRIPVIDEVPAFEASLAKFQTAFEEFGVKLDTAKSRKWE